MKKKIFTCLLISLCLTLSAEAKPHNTHSNYTHSIGCHHKVIPHHSHHHCHSRLGISFTSGTFRYYNPVYGYNSYFVTPLGYYSYPVGCINSPNLHINIGL